MTKCRDCGCQINTGTKCGPCLTRQQVRAAKKSLQALAARAAAKATNQPQKSSQNTNSICTSCSINTFGVSVRGLCFNCFKKSFNSVLEPAFKKCIECEKIIDWPGPWANHPDLCDSCSYKYYTIVYNNKSFSSFPKGILTMILIISNGDTAAADKLEFPAFSEEGKSLKILIDSIIPSRIFDYKRKCWFIPADATPALIKLAQALPRIIVHDKRIKIESFDEFFTEEARGISKAAPTSKAQLIKRLEFICKEQAGVYVSLREDCSIAELKRPYRQAALALHPDRNNGDSSKMAELNVVWAELQSYA